MYSVWLFRLRWPVVGFAALVLALTAAAQPARVRFDVPEPDVFSGRPTTFYSLLQDETGYLWLTTEEGLYRYDGYDFEVIPVDPSDPYALPTRRTLGLASDAQGRLWIGLDRFGLCRYDPLTERFERFPIREITGAPSSLAVDEGGTVWYTTEHDRALVKFFPEERRIERVSQINGTSVGSMFWVRRAPDSAIWLVEGEEDEPKIWRRAHESSWQQVGGVYGSLDFGGDGVIRAIGLDGSLNVFDPSRSAFEPEIGAPTENLGAAVNWHVDRRGLLWHGSLMRGFVGVVDLMTNKSTRFLSDPFDSETPPAALVQRVFEDRSGVVWFATEAGLRKVTPSWDAFESLPLPTPDFAIAFGRDRTGSPLISTMCGPVYRYDVTTQAFSRVEGVMPGCVSDVLETRDGSLWLAGWDRQLGGGLVRRGPNGRTTTFLPIPTDETSISNRSMRVLYEDRLGALWIATETGLDHFNAETSGFEHFRHNSNDPTSIGSSTVWALYEDVAGRFWVGTYGGGLALLDRETGRATRYMNDIDDPLSISSNIVTAILERPDEPGILWIGTAEGGLNRFDTAIGSFERFGRREGLPDLNIKSLLEDDLGRLWMGTGHGLVRFNPETRDVTVFTTADGLPEVDFGLFDAMSLEDGSFLFGTQRHLVRFRAEDVEAGAFEAPVVLTRVRAADRLLRLGPHPEAIRIAWEDRTLELGFAALNFSAPEHTRYRYQLVGFDHDWIESGDRRFATYTNLPPGRYTFRVQALSSSGVVSSEELAVPVEIVPPFWMTWWFRGLMIVLLAIGLILIVRQLATRKLKERVRAQNVALRLQHERERISRDLHDHVGAQLSNMLAGLELARLSNNSSGDGQAVVPTVDPLAGVEEDARITMRQLRETIWALHHEAVTPEAFAEQIRRDVATRLRHRDRPTADVKLADDNGTCELSPIQALHLFRIAQEAITNVIKHADAEHIEIRLSCKDEKVELVIQDDGTFRHEESEPGGSSSDLGMSGFGLSSMRARAEELGGTIELATKGGTTVRVIVPLVAPERIPAIGD